MIHELLVLKCRNVSVYSFIKQILRLIKNGIEIKNASQLNKNYNTVIFHEIKKSQQTKTKQPPTSYARALRAL